MNTQRSREELRSEIMRLVREYHDVAHARKSFEPGRTKVAYAGRVFDHEELEHGVESVLQ